MVVNVWKTTVLTCLKGPVIVFSTFVMHIAAPLRYLARFLEQIVQKGGVVNMTMT